MGTLLGLESPVLWVRIPLPDLFQCFGLLPVLRPLRVHSQPIYVLFRSVLGRNDNGFNSDDSFSIPQKLINYPKAPGPAINVLFHSMKCVIPFPSLPRSLVVFGMGVHPEAEEASAE